MNVVFAEPKESFGVVEGVVEVEAVVAVVTVGVEVTVDEDEDEVEVVEVRLLLTKELFKILQAPR